LKKEKLNEFEKKWRDLFLIYSPRKREGGNKADYRAQESLNTPHKGG